MKIKTLTAVIATVIAGLAVTTSAQATPTATAEAIVSLNNLVFSWDNAGTPGVEVSKNDLGLASISSTEQTAASVSGLGSTTSPITSSSTGTPLVNFATLGATPAAQAAELGVNSAVFTPLAAIPGTGNYAASGSNETGSPISNFFASPAAAALNNASYAQMDATTGVAGTNTNSNLSGKTTFTALHSGIIDVSFSASELLKAYLTAGSGLFAQASYNIQFTFIDLSKGGTSAINGIGNPLVNPFSGVFSLSNNLSDNAPGLGLVLGGTTSQADGLKFQTINLIAGDIYSLTGNITTAANVSLVPEPGIIALLGIGLMGIGAASSRKYSKSSHIAA